jgi:hypothetical protein
MSDLVRRLRETYHHDTLLDEAADRIEHLEQFAEARLSATARPAPAPGPPKETGSRWFSLS